MRSLLIQLWKDETGGEVIENVLVVGLMVIAAISLFGGLGKKVTARWQQIVDSLGA